MGPLEEGWDANFRFWIISIHLALADSAWLANPSVTLGTGGVPTTLINPAVSLPNLLGYQRVRIPTGASGTDLVAPLEDLSASVTVPGVVSTPGHSPLISIDYIGFWMPLASAVI